MTREQFHALTTLIEVMVQEYIIENSELNPTYKLEARDERRAAEHVAYNLLVTNPEE